MLSGPRRPRRPTRSSGPDDLVAIAFDDAVLDRLAARSRRSSSHPARWIDDGPGDAVPQLFADWQDRLFKRARPAPLSTDRAVELVAAGRHRPSFRPAVAIAVAICLLLFGATAIGARSARPGDPLFPVTQVLWSNQADSAVASQQVRDVINSAKAALGAGNPDHAAQLLQQASQGMTRISDGQDHAAVQQELAAALTLLERVSPAAARQVAGGQPITAGAAAGTGGQPAGQAGPLAAAQPETAQSQAPSGTQDGSLTGTSSPRRDRAGSASDPRVSSSTTTVARSTGSAGGSPAGPATSSRQAAGPNIPASTAPAAGSPGSSTPSLDSGSTPPVPSTAGSTPTTTVPAPPQTVTGTAPVTPPTTPSSPPASSSAPGTGSSAPGAPPPPSTPTTAPGQPDATTGSAPQIVGAIGDPAPTTTAGPAPTTAGGAPPGAPPTPGGTGTSSPVIPTAG